MWLSEGTSKWDQLLSRLVSFARKATKTSQNIAQYMKKLIDMINVLCSSQCKQKFFIDFVALTLGVTCMEEKNSLESNRIESNRIRLGPLMSATVHTFIVLTIKKTPKIFRNTRFFWIPFSKVGRHLQLIL